MTDLDYGVIVIPRELDIIDIGNDIQLYPCIDIPTPSDTANSVIVNCRDNETVTINFNNSGMLKISYKSDFALPSKKTREKKHWEKFNKNWNR